MRSLTLLLMLTAISIAEPPKIDRVPIPAPSDFVDKYNLRAGDVLLLKSGPDAVWSVAGLQKDYVLWQLSGNLVFNVPVETPKDTQFILLCSSKGETTQALVTITNEKKPDIKPPPVVPPITDLGKKIKDAYVLDTSVSTTLKPKALAQLIALYDMAQTVSKDPELMTIDVLRNTVRDAAAGMMAKFLSDNSLSDKDDAAKKVLESVRKVIAAEVAATFPDDGELDNRSRDVATAMYKRIYDSLVLLKSP